MKRAIAMLLLSCAALAGCGGGLVKRVSEPAVSIQQLTVRADGSWSIDLRLENFSSVPMRFERVAIPVSIGGVQAGTLQGTPSISVGPESADIATLAMMPASGARIAIADALASRRSVPYSLAGSVEAMPEDGRSRSFEVKRDSSLAPVPGLTGVLR